MNQERKANRTDDGKKHGASVSAVIRGVIITFVFLVLVVNANEENDLKEDISKAVSESVAESSTETAEKSVTKTTSEAVSETASEKASATEREITSESSSDTTAEASSGIGERTDAESSTEGAKTASREKKDLTEEIERVLTSDLTKPENVFKISDYPEYKDEPYVEVNNNHPFFEEEIKKVLVSESQLSDKSLQYYSALDKLGRCGAAYEMVSKDILPTEERGQIGDIQPSGWQTVKYPELIDDLYLYNRCHLIGYQLGGGNGDEQNLITGTRYMNMSGMLPFENSIAQYVEETGNHVAYRVTPVFDGDNLLASGVLMEAFSIEDSGAGVDFCVYAYNCQPGIEIDYATGDSREAEKLTADNTETQTESETDSNSRSIAESTTAENDSRTVVTEKSEDSVGSINTGSGRGSNFDTYDNPEQQNTTDAWVLNKNPKSMKIHHPSCKSVPKIAPKNYATSNESIEALEAKGYSKCKQCFK